MDLEGHEKEGGTLQKISSLVRNVRGPVGSMVFMSRVNNSGGVSYLAAQTTVSQ